MVNIKDSTKRRYHYSVTYYLKDGTPVPGAEEDKEIPSVVVKAYQPKP